MKKLFFLFLPLLLISCNLSSTTNSSGTNSAGNIEIVIENWCNHTVEVNIDNSTTPDYIFSESYLKITGISCGTHNITIKKSKYQMEPTKTKFTIPDNVIKKHFYILGNPENGYTIKAMK